MLIVLYRGAAAPTIGYGVNMGEVHYSEYMAMEKLNGFLEKCDKHPLTPEEILNLKAKEQARIYDTLPLRSIRVNSENFVNDLDIIIRKREKEMG
jgi:hypothetical protein